MCWNVIVNPKFVKKVRYFPKFYAVYDGFFKSEFIRLDQLDWLFEERIFVWLIIKLYNLEAGDAETPSSSTCSKILTRKQRRLFESRLAIDSISSTTAIVS